MKIKVREAAVYEASLCMCVAASRSQVVFDDNEWHSCPVKGGKNVNA